MCNPWTHSYYLAISLSCNGFSGVCSGVCGRGCRLGCSIVVGLPMGRFSALMGEFSLRLSMVCCLFTRRPGGGGGGGGEAAEPKIQPSPDVGSGGKVWLKENTGRAQNADSHRILTRGVTRKTAHRCVRHGQPLFSFSGCCDLGAP